MSFKLMLKSIGMSEIDAIPLTISTAFYPMILKLQVIDPSIVYFFKVPNGETLNSFTCARVIGKP